MSEDFKRAMKEAGDEAHGKWLHGKIDRTSPNRGSDEVRDEIRRMREGADVKREDVEKSIEDVKRKGDLMRRLRSPMFKRVTERLESGALKNLECPECGGGDKANRMNGKPWCFKCNVPLVKAGKASKWIKIKHVGRGLDAETLNKIRGLPDDGGIAR